MDALRFEDRVQDYLRSRPGYPRQVLDVLREAMGVPPPTGLADFRLDWSVADLGAGTGLLSLPFLEAGCAVRGVDPSPSMVEAARRVLARFPGFSVSEGRAEATGLADGSVDLAVAGQAFHWFDPDGVRRELQRILRGPKVVAIVWNRRRQDGAPFAVAYETFLKSWGIDYEAVMARYESAEGLRALFGRDFAPRLLPNHQRLDREGLLSRLRSCSYLPGAGHERFSAMVRAAEGLFEAHAQGGFVTLNYDTAIYAGGI